MHLFRRHPSNVFAFNEDELVPFLDASSPRSEIGRHFPHKEPPIRRLTEYRTDRTPPRLANYRQKHERHASEDAPVPQDR